MNRFALLSFVFLFGCSSVKEDKASVDLNAGNVQIAHAITFVLRPADL